MLMINLATASEVCQELGQRLRAQRLALLLTQAELAARAGVAIGTVRTLETTGMVSADSLVRLALTMGLADSLQNLFEQPQQSIAQMELAQRKPRQRAPRQRVSSR
jgi:transcriptional regulator with XRE-family HTH domain